VKDDFDAAAWVTVSKSYQVEDLLKKIAQELGVSVDVRNMEMRGLAEVIRNHLQGISCILILDDVWENYLWISIMDVFQSNCISRIVFKSRNFEVASMATENCTIELTPLADDDSYVCSGKITD
jgi:disease resistance protein RPM1